MKIIVYCQQKVKNTVRLRQNELYAAKEDVFKRSMLQISDILMQGGKRMENKMFCYQCQETAGCTGCTQAGVCGKKPDVAAMQDLLVFVTKGLAAVTTQLRAEGREIPSDVNYLVTFNLFTTDCQKRDVFPGGAYGKVT